MINQANPISGTRYPVLPLATGGIWILSATVECAWTVQPTPIQVHLDIDGIPTSHNANNPITATPYGLTKDMGNRMATQLNQLLSQTYSAGVPSLEYKGRAISVEAEITGGTVQSLECRVKWARLI